MLDSSCFVYEDRLQLSNFRGPLHYSTRRAECRQSAQQLGLSYLTELTTEQLSPLLPVLPRHLARRAMHVGAEHARVEATVTALTKGDLATVGRLLTASHRSSQHLFENSAPALDSLVDLLEQHPAVWGARLTGGGFGGAVMALTRSSFSESDAQTIGELHAARHGLEPGAMQLRVDSGAILKC